MYSSRCDCCGGELHDLSDDTVDWDKIYSDIARQLINGEDLNTDAIYNQTAKQLISAMNKGLGGTSFDDADSRQALQNAFKANLEAFSYAKTLTQFKLFKDAMFNDKGQIQSFATVKKAVADTGEVFNKNYLAAEHQFVTQSAIMAHKWETLDSEYLEFTTVGDGKVRPEHKLFDKFTALKTDPIWKRLYTPLSWGCRCTIIPGITKNVSKEYDSDWANKVVDPLVKGTIFDNNVGLTKVIFNDKHPYFKEKKAKTDNYDYDYGSSSSSSKTESPIGFKLTSDNIEQLKGLGFKFDIANEKGFDIFNEHFSKFNLKELNIKMDALAKENNINFNFKKINVHSNGIDIHYFDTKNNAKVSRKLFHQDSLKIVKHEFFELPTHLQGKGFSKQMFKIWHEQYLAADIDKIKVHANLDIGGYTWAKYGFKPYEKNQLLLIKLNAREALNKGLISKEDFADFISITQKSQDGLWNLHQIANTPYGKKILLGSSWMGELDLKDKNSKQTYENYLFGRK